MPRRTSLSALLALVLITEAAMGQGRIIPRPCTRAPCPAPMPCLGCPAVLPVLERLASDVSIDLRRGVLQYEVSETFVNRGRAVAEADYIFPLPHGAAFQDLRLRVNGELVAGETMNAVEARRIYEEIVRQQRDPALVEWMGHGLLRARIFPIAPGEEKKVVIRFQAVVPREGDALRVDYFRGGGQSRGDRNSNGAESRGTLRLTYPVGESYGEAYSPTHRLVVRTQSGRREVVANGSASEVTILISLLRSSGPAISVLTHSARPRESFALIRLSPPAVSQIVTARDVTLVLDVSGSMSGAKIRQARAAGKQVLATLSPRDRFRLISFSTDVDAFREGMAPATEQNLRDASRYLETLQAAGSTNISAALDETLRDPVVPGRLPLVLFVTDGEPTAGELDPEAIARRVARLRGDRRLFSFGVGADINVTLVERLAVEGRGTAHFVRPDESVERAVSLVASRLTNPVVTDLRIRADGVRLFSLHPSGPADIFAGQDHVILARYEGGGPARLTFDGRSAAGPVSWSSQVVFPARSGENLFVARLWATQRIGYLAAEKRKNGGSPEIDAEIRELGERYGIPTEFSSYLVLEPGMARSVAGAARRAPLSAMAAGVDAANAVVTGAATGGAPPAPASPFETARASAAQRAASTTAVADESLDIYGGTARRAGSGLFVLRDGVWTDTRWSETMRVVNVRPYSAAYFRLLEELPGLLEPFALGDSVIAAGRGVAIRLTPDGRENLDARELASVKRDW